VLVNLWVVCLFWIVSRVGLVMVGALCCGWCFHLFKGCMFCCCLV
jgi:hypothetical protein